MILNGLGCRDRVELAICLVSPHCGVISKVFIAFFRPRRSYRRAALQLGKAPSCLYIYDRLGSQASKARATRVGKHNKLLRLDTVPT